MCFRCRTEGLDRAPAGPSQACAAASVTVVSSDGEIFHVGPAVLAHTRLKASDGAISVTVDGPTLRLLLDWCQRSHNVRGDAGLLRIAWTRTFLPNPSGEQLYRLVSAARRLGVHQLWRLSRNSTAPARARAPAEASTDDADLAMFGDRHGFLQCVSVMVAAGS